MDSPGLAENASLRSRPRRPQAGRHRRSVAHALLGQPALLQHPPHLGQREAAGLKPHQGVEEQVGHLAEQGLVGLGFEGAARVCLTHSFAGRRIEGIFGVWDCTPVEQRFIEEYLARVELDDYDRLIILCDSLAMADGFVLMEKRMLDVALRYGEVNEHTLAKWRATLAIKADFERAIGCPVYALLPGVVENTFGFSPADSRGQR